MKETIGFFKKKVPLTPGDRTKLVSKFFLKNDGQSSK
jgi:hypothetical protein